MVCGIRGRPPNLASRISPWAHSCNGRGSAISSLSVRALPSVTAVSRDEWNALFPPTAEDWNFLRASEMAPPAGFSASALVAFDGRSEEHTSELQSRPHLVCRLLLEKKKDNARLPVHVKNNQKRILG